MYFSTNADAIKIHIYICEIRYTINSRMGKICGEKEEKEKSHFRN